MRIHLTQYAPLAYEKLLSGASHILFVLPELEPVDLPFKSMLQAKLTRTQAEYKDLAKTPASIELPSGGIASFVVLADQLNMFQKHTLLRKAAKCLLDEKPENLSICVFGDEATREANACAAYYVVTVNAVELPNRKKESKLKPLKNIAIVGYQAEHDYGYVNARVAGNTLCRTLSITPPNDLTPAVYREKVKKLATKHGWAWQEFDMATLKQMGAGAFYAVGQGSEPMDAAIVHLTYTPKQFTKNILQNNPHHSRQKSPQNKNRTNRNRRKDPTTGLWEN